MLKKFLFVLLIFGLSGFNILSVLAADAPHKLNITKSNLDMPTKPDKNKMLNLESSISCTEMKIKSDYLKDDYKAYTVLAKFPHELGADPVLNPVGTVSEDAALKDLEYKVSKAKYDSRPSWTTNFATPFSVLLTARKFTGGTWASIAATPAALLFETTSRDTEFSLKYSDWYPIFPIHKPGPNNNFSLRFPFIKPGMSSAKTEAAKAELKDLQMLSSGKPKISTDADNDIFIWQFLVNSGSNSIPAIINVNFKNLKPVSISVHGDGTATIIPEYKNANSN